MQSNRADVRPRKIRRVICDYLLLGGRIMIERLVHLAFMDKIICQWLTRAAVAFVSAEEYLMKALIIAAGLVVVGATSAAAQYAPQTWAKGSHPYAQRNHSVCQDKAIRLHKYEHRAASDGVLTRAERQTIVALKRDLDRTCGRYRWRG